MQIRPGLELSALLIVFGAGCSAKPHDAVRRELLAPRAAIVLPPLSGESERERARHALDRLAFGPRPGDVEAVAKQGVARWITRQLDPRSIADETAEKGLALLPTLSLPTSALYERYPGPRAVAAKAGLSLKDPDGKEKVRSPERAEPHEQVRSPERAEPHEQVRSPERAEPQEQVRALVNPGELPRQILKELIAQKVYRAAVSERQLEEVLVDFWFNHFNVFAEKGDVRWLLTSYERDAIRPHVLGKFRDLLGATAAHPAMLFYLDNWTSTKDGLRRGGRTLGLNENYARELLELHTIGVDGGYTQNDVREVARCFTGWSFVRERRRAQQAPEEIGAFVFREAAHDRGAKTVLGTLIPAGGGIDDARRVLDLLAERPETARFLATKLCRRFLADDPPEAAVARVAEAFRRSGGDLSVMMRALVTSPEMWSDAARGAKTKTPFELAISATRALGASVSPYNAIPSWIEKMGAPLYRCQPPTGFADTASAWVNAGGLLARLNFGLALSAGRIAGVKADPGALAGTNGDALERLSRALLATPPSQATRDAIAGIDEIREPDAIQVAGLLLGSPEFQKR